MYTVKEMKDDLKEACYVGEDGAMATICRTKRGAWIKFRKQVREDCGDIEAEQIRFEDVGPAYACLATPEQLEENDEAPWYVFPDKRLNSIEIWFLNV